MSGISKKLMGTTAAGGGELETAIEEVFSTYLYTGNGSTQTITNGIDLAGEGGLVWLKSRNFGYSHFLFDTVRGASSTLSISTGAAFTTSRISSFNVDGFTLGVDEVSNNAAYNYASWTFRKAPRFFDVVTYTGTATTTGDALAVPHNLGVTPGMIIVKRTDASALWVVYHRSNTAEPETDYLSLNSTAATLNDASVWNNTAPTNTDFTVGYNGAVNISGATYVAYLYAHDPLGPSEDGSDGLIACGSYTGNGSADGPEIDLGWEPQWLLVKNSTTSGYQWSMLDSMRGLSVSGNDARLFANASNAEFSEPLVDITPTGFKLAATDGSFNRSGDTYIYIAIRRGPMRAPESGAEVFSAISRTGGGSSSFVSLSGFPSDLFYIKRVDGSGSSAPGLMFDRIRGGVSGGYGITPSSTAAENSAYAINGWDAQNNDGVRVGNINNYWDTSGAPYVNYHFRRAPNFFDVVAKKHSVDNEIIEHNLGVIPELIIKKRRDAAGDWYVSCAYTEGTRPYFRDLKLNSNAGQGGLIGWTVYDDTTISNTSFKTGGNVGDDHIFYLFATLAGVSKVGSYTGNGTSQTINCGFTAGARFILIKRTDAAGDWYVWDTARGIVTGNDPHLSLNTTAAEVTTDDSIDPASSGFIVNQVAATNINVSAASYIFYAVA